VKRNVDKHLGSICKETKVEIKDDVSSLQASQSSRIFKKAAELFLIKWKKEAAFIKYFEKMWLAPERVGWYQGFASAIPDHNNNNEADNRYIKEDQDRKRLGLIQFLNHACDNLIRGWSKRREAASFNYIQFHTHPQLELKDWTNAWQWSSLEKQLVHYKKNGRDVYCTRSGLEKLLSTRDCTKYFNVIDDMNWDNFDDYTSHVHMINYVSWVRKDWIKSKCSCIWWAKNYCCHHVIGLAVSKNKCEYLDLHMQIPIGVSRPRGQPKKTATALNKQEDNMRISSDSSSSTSDSDASDPSPMKKKTTKKTKIIQQKKTQRK